MIFTKHLKEKLDERYPNWDKDTITKKVTDNPSFTADGETHIYLGTAFDIWEYISGRKQLRKRFKRRHLFLVMKGDVALTATFHTSASIIKWINKKDIVLNNSVDAEEIRGIKVSEQNATVYLDKQSHLQLRPDLYWEYESPAGVLRVEVQSIN